jgi:4-hydroxybenzoate polyprenyltransferase
VALYPFAKRFTDWPQFFLGLAFSWGALMGWAAVFGSLSLAAGLLYLASVVWTIGYDTIYAHQDKEDDELIGVRSTARLFGDKTRQWLVGLYGLTLVLMFCAFLSAGVGLVAYLGLLAAAGMFAWQIVTLDINDGDQCLALFKSNNRVGLIIFAGLVPLAAFRHALAETEKPGAWAGLSSGNGSRADQLRAMISLPSIFIATPSLPVVRRTRKRGRRLAK